MRHVPVCQMMASSRKQHAGMPFGGVLPHDNARNIGYRSIRDSCRSYFDRTSNLSKSCR
jgi:hypothetical protein